MYNKYYKKSNTYFKKNPEYNSFVHALGGIGIGILIASPFANPHPVRWALIFLGLSLIGHIYAWMSGK